MKTLNLFKSNLLKGLFVLALILYSCNKDNDGFDILDKMSDDELIEAIAKSSEKQEIDYNQLPSSAKNIINEDYETMIAEISFKVEDLGYEVTMIDYTPLNVADKNEVYFNKNGRELVPEDKKSEKGKRKKKKNPFKFVFPVSFEMPDGSTITANDREGLKSLIKAWYDENPDSKEKPKLVYPVDLDFGEGKIVTVNSEEEMKEIKEKLRGRASQGQSNNGPKGR